MDPPTPLRRLRTGQMLGKYRLERRLGVGGFATVYQASDTIEGLRVALKIPHPLLWNKEALEDFRREVRVAAKLDHPHILPVKNADFIEGLFVVAFPLAERSLGDRLQSRLGLSTVLDYGEQMLSAVSYAHQQRVIHCDIKPDNFLIFPGNRLMLSDFGLAKIAMRTMHASGSGTVGYVAPEQALGKPSFRSDVFSLGLILYRMLAGHLPDWPYEWPPPGAARLRRLPDEMITLLRRSILVDARKRYRDAAQMLLAFRRAKSKALRGSQHRTTPTKSGPTRDWKTVRRRQFLQRYGNVLEAYYTCRKCKGPVSEAMQYCPWCGDHRECHRDNTTFPQRCPRCKRGMKLDWKYCAWCFGPGFEVTSPRQYSDRRYAARCSNPRCSRKDLMPFMRYCPWCRRKVRKSWQIPGDSRDTCSACHWGVLGDFWSYCPWCGKPLAAPRVS